MVPWVSCEVTKQRKKKAKKAKAKAEAAASGEAVEEGAVEPKKKLGNSAGRAWLSLFLLSPDAF